ncbi:MAG: PEP-CTERM system histidine kinase PrsK [Rhodocyclaceae bacterium]|nr:PEP-CTERM system histidine kinase PrsK [Rhodocyclaceae bacterium]
MLDVARAGYGFAACVHALFGLYLLLAWRGGRPGMLLLGAVGLGAVWSGSAFLALGGDSPALALIASVVDYVRIGAWFAFLLVLLRMLGVDRPGLRWGCAAIVLSAMVMVVGQLALAGSQPAVAQLTLRGTFLASLLAAVLGLVLIEQLFRSLPADGRWAFKPMSLGLAAVFAFDIYFYAEGLLFQQVDAAVWAVRGFAHAVVLPLVALTVARNPGWKIRISISRQAVFHTSALLASGVYLLMVAGAGYYLQFFGGDWGRAFQVALIFAGVLALLVVLVSGALRARLRVWLSKHLFAYKYDYRSEWLKFTRALSATGETTTPEEAVIGALADLVESPGGGIWLSDGAGECAFRHRLNMPEVDASERMDGPFATFLAQRGWIVNLAEFRSRRALYEGLVLPEWLSKLDGAWLVVPLTNGGALAGFVVLLSPRTPVDVDWEVLDLLKTAQQQAASYLSQLQAQEALLEAKKFDAFNRMSAFVVHDLKNLVAQLSLLLKNAERHRDNPEFQQDMLETVAHVEGRMRALMKQLMEKTSIDPRKPVDLAVMVRAIARSKAGQSPAPEVVECASVSVLAHAERLERILGHIVQNAMDATGDDGKVQICVRPIDGGAVEVDVIDNGCGMSPEFVRDELFKPFRSTKASGMGIGAYESRQYVKEIGGSIEVASEPGAGTRMRVRLPACAPAAGSSGSNHTE